MARILVAEDDPDIANLLAHYLNRAGFEGTPIEVNMRVREKRGKKR